VAAGEGWAGTWAANVVAHSTNPRLQRDLELLAEFKPPVVITALGSPARVIETVHRWGGVVIADVASLRFARKAAEVGVDGLLLVATAPAAPPGR
jgi:nitronate monooxygenase